MQESPWYTTEQAAIILQRHPDTIRRLCQKGRLEGARKFGGEWYIPRNTINPSTHQPHKNIQLSPSEGAVSMTDEPPQSQHTSPFESIKRFTEESIEYWSARELYKLLGYSTWQKFQHAIKQAILACEQSGQVVSDHFNPEVKIVKAGITTKTREDYQLSRYACYLIVQNADPAKPIVALGQTYFALQTRRQELADELATLPEDQKRLTYRSQMAIFNTRLADAAQLAGVIEPMDFAIFQDHGYRGLYRLTAQQIHNRKGLQEGQHILDYMSSEELGANIFRATQTEAKLRRENISSKEQANKAHHQVGQKVRQTIKELGGTMPENLPTPQESIQELERKEQKRLKQRNKEKPPQ